MPRDFFGRFGVNKVYVGSKTVNVSIDSDQALELAVAIIRAAKNRRKIDLAIYRNRATKRPGGKIPQGMIPVTVTVHRPV